MASPRDNHPPYTASAAFNATQVTHGFFGRQGGVSTGLHASLNTGAFVEDDFRHVAENRARIAASMNVSPEHLYILTQKHTTTCLSVGDAIWKPEDVPEGDALVTDRPGRLLGVLGADCAPVLFHARNVVGAAHAGRQGALNGILESTIVSMMDYGVKSHEIIAVVGPCIGPASYELSESDVKPFLEDDPASGRYFTAGKPGHVMFDLPGYCLFRLKRAGLREGCISAIGHDTLTMKDQYFSHRRATLAGEKTTGRQLSVISLK